mgnify:CR=1 FL=1
MSPMEPGFDSASIGVPGAFLPGSEIVLDLHWRNEAALGLTLERVDLTHDLALVRRRFRRCLAVNGSLRADGAPTEVLTTEVLERTFGSSDALAH